MVFRHYLLAKIVNHWGEEILPPSSQDKDIELVIENLGNDASCQQNELACDKRCVEINNIAITVFLGWWRR